MNRLIAWTLPLITLILTGCGTSSPTSLSPQGLSTLKGRALIVAYPASTTDFIAFTPGKAALGLIGEAAMRREGNRIVIENNVMEPTEPVAQALAQGLRARLGSPAPQSKGPLLSDNRSAASLSAKAANRTDLVLYVQTNDWRTWYYPTNFNRYRVRMVVNARLVDLATQTEIAQASCEEDSPKAADASPTYDEMTGSGAQRLKQELSRAQAACVATLQQGLMGQ